MKIQTFFINVEAFKEMKHILAEFRIIRLVEDEWSSGMTCTSSHFYAKSSLYFSIRN
jgi:hypothetical protein